MGWVVQYDDIHIKQILIYQARAQVHRPISEIQFNRELKKIMEKSTWFLPSEREEEDATAPGRRTGELHMGPGRSKKKKKSGPQPKPGKRNPYAPVAPLFDLGSKMEPWSG